MKPVNVGIIGLGRLGMVHAKDLMFNIPEANLTAACSVIDAELDQVKQWGGVSLFNDYHKMLSEADIDAVFIVSPSSEHAQQIKDALAAGKHVFSEKPMGVTVEECLDVEKAVAAHPGQKFQLGFMRRFDPSYAEAKKKVDAGEIGKVFLIKSTSNDPISTVDSFLEYAPRSGGPWLDMSVHDIDLAHWFMGDDIETIYAIGDGYIYPQLRDCNCADNACALMKFKNGGIAQMHVGYTSPHGYQVETEIFGDKANLRISAVPAKDRIQIYAPAGVTVECDPYWPVRFKDAFLLEKKDFIACINEDRTPLVGAKDGTRTTRVAFAATEAFNTGELIRL
ncbi:MAG: Gfo/Idh/MocA family protein [Christensenellaceae bacterium]|jgi:myo-inositol 2-dehydrogenase/D-chiro-inositol 1-dehydrogenase